MRIRRPSPSPNGAAASVSRELSRLDPFSFFVLPGRAFGVEHVVVGATGTFAIGIGHDSVDGKFRRDVLRARRAAKRVRRDVGVAAVHTSVQAMVCLPGRQFLPKTVHGVKVISWGMVVAEVAQRRRTVTAHQAQRVAEALAGITVRARAAEH